MRPQHGQEPVAIALWKTVQPLIRAFNATLVEHDTSWQRWHVLRALGMEEPRTQRELASSVGVREATLTHHLRALEDKGLITRTRPPENRRIQHVEYTAAGRRLFAEIRDAVLSFDQELREMIGTEQELQQFMRVLARLRDAVPTSDRSGADWPTEPGAS